VASLGSLTLLRSQRKLLFGDPQNPSSAASPPATGFSLRGVNSNRNQSSQPQADSSRQLDSCGSVP
jgi:hypothetical protein